MNVWVYGAKYLQQQLHFKTVDKIGQVVCKIRHIHKVIIDSFGMVNIFTMDVATAKDFVVKTLHKEKKRIRTLRD